MPIVKYVGPRVELEPGVFLYPEARVVRFEKDVMTWPLPRPGVAACLHGHALVPDGPPLQPHTLFTAETIISAYEQMIWDDREKRQRVVRCLRKAIDVMRTRDLEPGTVATVDACARAGMVKP